MKTLLLLSSLLPVIMAVSSLAQEKFETDIIKTSAGDLKITFIGQKKKLWVRLAILLFFR